MRKRVWTAGIFMALGLLAGCSQKEMYVSEEQEVQQEETAAEVPYDEPLPEDYEGTLTMWGWDEEYYRTVTEAFQKKYPNVKFTYTSVKNGDLPSKYATALLAVGELPDIAL